MENFHKLLTVMVRMSSNCQRTAGGGEVGNRPFLPTRLYITRAARDKKHSCRTSKKLFFHFLSLVSYLVLIWYVKKVVFDNKYFWILKHFFEFWNIVRGLPGLSQQTLSPNPSVTYSVSIDTFWYLKIISNLYRQFPYGKLLFLNQNQLR